MMHLHHLDIEILVEQARGLFGQRHGKIHADGEIGRLDDGDRLGGGLDRPLFRGFKPGGADHQDGAGLGGELGMIGRRLGRGEIENGAGGGKQRTGIVADRDADVAETRQGPDIGTDGVMARPLAGRRDGTALGFCHSAGQRKPHAPGGADDPYAQISHVC